MGNHHHHYHHHPIIIIITITNTITILFLRADDQRGFSDKVLDSWEEGEGADLFNFRSKLQNVT